MKLTKEQVEYYVNAKPRTSEIPGYFTDDGKLVLGPFYKGHLGKKNVGYADGFPSYVKDANAYLFRGDALEGAKAFQAKMREWLEAGNYEEVCR